ncbi:heparinase II/III domain-containing protein, partial [Vibrio sp. V02_P2A34T13]|uniref:heparinase II/III domain-containing protein n=2 Tax=Vibrio sp. V02_P2A34T13 TaxID=1982231 RepID=UPI000D0B99CE
MNTKFIYSIFITMDKKTFLRKGFRVVSRKIKNEVNDLISITKKSYVTGASYYLKGNLEKISFTQNDESNIAAVCDLYLQHRFDLLGSGWVEVEYDVVAPGLDGKVYNQNIDFDLKNNINRSNRAISQNIWRHIDSSYRPIDWQKDFKTGFRWSEKKRYTKQRAYSEGADIKLPWEIGRLQHLPQLAIAANEVNDSRAIDYLNEIKNQLLDFIASNPPQWGVQWTCTMDVGIRVANIVLAWDLIHKHGLYSTTFTNETEQIIANSVYDHSKHIVNNLEYGENLTSNHYLSDIVGLLYSASYLNSTPETDAWLAFAVQEVISEFDKQYHSDGSNFEASTCYHRLSTELMVFATAKLGSLDISRLRNYDYSLWTKLPILNSLEYQKYELSDSGIELPSSYYKKLAAAITYTKDMTKPNGNVIQFGDNDSGRFFKLTPVGEWLETDIAIDKYQNLNGYENLLADLERFWDENILDHSTLVSAAGGIFAFCSDVESYESKVTSGLFGKQRREQSSYIEVKCDEWPYESEFSYTNVKSFSFSGSKLTSDLTLKSYPDAGTYIFKSERLFLAISIGTNGQLGNGGHAHNDRMSFELNVDCKDVVVDPGSYLYTASNKQRNLFRSTSSHNTLFANIEQNRWVEGRLGLFSMYNDIKTYVLSCGND